MDQAWLDSLSEDWVSQPRSGSPEPDLPSLSHGTSESSSARANASRIPIPKFNTQTQSWLNAQDSNPLSERSLNENNIPLSQRSHQPSKLRSELSPGSRGRKLSRRLSSESAQSVQYHTVQHKSLSASPKKSSRDTPEWKKRLLHGDVAYGEQRDLFSAAGLETIFQPPPSANASRRPPNFGESSVMPSSPPLYRPMSGPRRFDDSELPSDDQPIQDDEDRLPRATRYRMVDDYGSEFSTNDLSRGSDFRPSAVNTISPAKNQIPSDSVPHNDNLSAKTGHLDVGRVISGQSDIRNEGLSPIYMTRHNTEDGFTPLNISPSELQQRLEQLKVDDSHIEKTNELRNTSQPLPEDITTDTDDFKNNGNFVNVRRGGRSQEGSFQNRMLSPSSLPPIDESALLIDESTQINTTQLPKIRKTRASNDFLEPQGASQLPPVTHTPHGSPTKSSAKSSSGSPLKLFGAYDTFTSQKLLRRLSQYEEKESDNEETVPPNTAFEPTNRDMNGPSATRRISENRRPPREHTSRRFTSFGVGDLDSFRFSEEASFNSNTGNEEEPRHVELPVLDPKSQTRFRFRLGSSPVLKDGVITERTKSTTTTSSTTKHTLTVHKKRSGSGSSTTSTVHLSSQTRENLKTPRKSNGDVEGKRLPRSPLKDPTPKRRRTLHRADTSLLKSEDSFQSDSPGSAKRPIQVSSERKRKSARRHEDQATHSKILAMRQVLRPRTPTPSQRSSQQRDDIPFTRSVPIQDQSARLSQERKIAMIQAELDSIHTERPLGASLQSQDSRKPSVTTQDFLDEAKKIMAGIRGKARPRSGLTSLEESQNDIDPAHLSNNVPDEEFDDSYQESTQEPFSRPPSREGPPVSRQPPTQQDPELLDHLRKYEEKSDMDGIIASSIKSLAMAKDAIRNAEEADRIADATISRSSGRASNSPVSSENNTQNIRISRNPDMQRKRKHSGSSQQVDEDYPDIDFLTTGSNGSVPTTSSRGSDSRRVIAPHTVSHLIPEQLAGMVFDRERNIWVKKKSVSGEKDGPNFLPSDETEDDPFEDIPDLSVDETQELMRLRAVAAKRKEDARLAKYLDDEGQQDMLNERSKNQQTEAVDVSEADVRPHSAPSKPTRRGSDDSIPEVKIRAASMGTDNNLRSKKSRGRSGKKSPHKNHSSAHGENEEVINQDISISDDYEMTTPQRPRNVTITFSSPIAEVIEAPNYTDDENIVKEDAYQSDYESFNESVSDSIAVRKRKTKQKNGLRAAFRGTTRKLSVDGQQFMPRPVSRIDEQDEESFNKDNDTAKRNGSLVPTTSSPRKRDTNSVVLATPRPLHEIGTLELTPLSEFTIHQADESFGLNVSYVAKGKKHVPDDNDGKKTLSHSIKELVEKLTEVEPYEPFWEHMKEAVLKDKKLTSLHKLDQFCGHLEDLEVSNNQINQLNGAPSSLRNLTITHNQLSDLTAWGHLWNLQQVDVSNNDIESLSCFKNLVHLRVLKADNNKITSLQGISNLDGLTTLRLRGNPIETVDFGNTKLKQLTDLDLKNCQIKEVRNIGQLGRLIYLNLDNNKLDTFLFSNVDVCWAPQIQLSGNNLESFDASRTPQLRLLYLDYNRIKTITGLLNKKRLDSLSVREQQPGTIMDTSFISEAFEVRKLYLSGNFLGTWDSRAEFLNLQYLELANCGITSLPDDFGLLVPNLRVLNLNFNALEEFQCLLGIVRLKKLLVAGNRLCKVERLTRTLTAFSCLTAVDMRNNFVNHGFYPIAAERQLVKDGGFEKDDLGVNDPYTLGNADPSRDAHYSSCLDMSTKMMRRIYEIMIFGEIKDNPRLKIVDGLPVNRSVLQIRDAVWDRLVESNIVKDPDAKVVVEDLHENKAGDRKGKEKEKSAAGSADTETSKEAEKVQSENSSKSTMDQGQPANDEDDTEFEAMHEKYKALKLKMDRYWRFKDSNPKDLRKNESWQRSVREASESLARNQNPSRQESLKHDTRDKPAVRKRVEFFREERWPVEDSFA